jgi:hypothetical protein
VTELNADLCLVPFLCILAQVMEAASAELHEAQRAHAAELEQVRFPLPYCLVLFAGRASASVLSLLLGAVARSFVV